MSFYNLVIVIVKFPEAATRTPFLQSTSRRLFLSFCKKILANLNNVRQTKVQKRFIYVEKKQSMEEGETNANASYSN